MLTLSETFKKYVILPTNKYIYVKTRAYLVMMLCYLIIMLLESSVSRGKYLTLN